MFVSANSQAKYMENLLDGGMLSEEELVIYKRGRNTRTTSVAKNADVITYRVATGFEALWGYLYLLDDKSRLEELWQLFISVVGEI